MTPCLTCYGKQRRHFDFLAIWRTRAAILILTYYLGFGVTATLKFVQYGGHTVILNLTLTCNVNKTTILHDFRGNFKRNFELIIR